MILGVGELLWDLFPDGRKVAGGAPFNFAFHCHQLGHPAAVVSRVGDDELGRELRTEVRRLGMSDEFIQTDHDHPTGTVRVTVGDAGQPSYEIVEDVAWDYIEWLEPTARRVCEAKAICFGTLCQRNRPTRDTLGRYLSNAYGFVGLDQAFDQLPWAEQGGADDRQPLIVFDVNLRADAYDRETISESLRGSDWLKLNEEELAVFVGLFDLDWFSDSTALRAVAEWNNWDKDTAILTCGSNGCLVQRWREVGAADEGSWDALVDEESVPGVKAAVVDTVGAGDAFTAAMVCLHLEGKPLAECARFAVRYAAKVCEHQGATPTIDRREVE